MIGDSNRSFVLLAVGLIVLIALSGCVGNDGTANNSTKTSNPITPVPEDASGSTQTPTETESSTSDENTTTGTPKPESAYSSPTASVDFVEGFNHNVSVILTDVKAADHIYVIDTGNHKMTSTIQDDADYQNNSVSRNQLLLTGEYGGEGTRVMVGVDSGSSGTIRVIGVLNGTEKVVAEHSYNTTGS